MPTTLTRSFLVVFVPGIVALAPWMLLFVREVDEAAALYKAYTLPVQLVAFASVVVVGSTIENVSSRFETRWDKQRLSEFDVGGDWTAYLVQAYANEPVMHRYISRMVTTMYYELAIMQAIPLFMVGAGWLAGASSLPSRSIYICVAIVLGLFLPPVLCRSAKETHKVLCESRQDLRLSKNESAAQAT